MRKYKYLSLIIIYLPLLLFFTVSCQPQKGKQRERIEMDTIASIPTPPILKYGLPVDSFIIEDGTVKPNQHLSHIL
ncbi:MAG: hypothetical protein LC658_12070, partial [Bacteroidales bacterium]|nr:hypothetical protein [Bacteroidales bacterium]